MISRAIKLGCLTMLFCVVVHAQARVALYKSTSDPAGLARVQAMLGQTSGAPAMIDLHDDWSNFALIVMVSPPIPVTPHAAELSFTQKLATYYLLGGRVLLAGVPNAGKYPQSKDDETWDRLLRYFWNIPLHAAGNLLEDSDHRATFVPDVATLGSAAPFGEMVKQLLSANDILPDQVPAEDFGPAPKIEVRDNSLWVDGRAQFLKGIGYYDFVRTIPMSEHEAAFRLFHEMGFNSVITIADYDVDENQVRQFLDLARKYQIYVQLETQGPVDSDEPLRKEYLLKLLRFRNHPALIGWSLCDDSYDLYYPFFHREAEILRKYDHRLPLTTTMMDNRRPERVKDWDKWKRMQDFPLTYIYPMQRDLATLGYKGELEGGLKDIGILEANTRKVWGDVFAEQFLQAHMQGAFAEAVGFKSWLEHMLPTADQERLMTYRALLTGVKGLMYFYPQSLEDQGMGRGRRNELGIIWRELEPVEGIIAAGARPVMLKTSDTTVDASWIASGRDAVVLAVKDQTHYNRYVDQGGVDRLSITLPESAAACSVYQLQWPQLAKLAVQGHEVTLNPFHLTAALLATCDDARVREAQATIEKNLRDVAGYAMEVLADEQVKTMIVNRHLPQDLQGSARQWNAAVNELTSARTAAQSGDWLRLWQLSRAGLEQIEEHRAEAIRAATADSAKHPDAALGRVYLNTFFSLPNYAYVTRGTPAVVPGQLRREILEAQGEPVWSTIDRAAH